MRRGSASAMDLRRLALTAAAVLSKSVGSADQRISGARTRALLFICALPERIKRAGNFSS